jgi:hypothetical protein
VWLVLTSVLACSLGACSGGYPLPATRCDEWCDATKGGTCEQYYDPANCVSACEQSHTDTEACRVQFDMAISCFRKNPAAVEDQCSFYTSGIGIGNKPRLCGSELDAVGFCVGRQSFPSKFR